jgi:shikimate dehydrogenase
MEIGGSTRLLAVLGDPVAHSLSPCMQNAACRALGLDAVYVALRVPAASVPAVLGALAAVGAAGNVTVPHKEAVERSVTRKTDLCARSGACNTFWTEAGALVGDNTDVAGIHEALRELDVDGAGRWLVIGTGGSARAVAVAAGGAKAQLLVRSRDARRARTFADWAASIGVRAAVAQHSDEADVVVNTTPLGLRPGDALPVDPAALRGARVVLDLVYAAGGTPWVRAARAAGLRAADGRGVLLHQGAAAFSRFFPDQRPPLEVMRAALSRALGV